MFPITESLLTTTEHVSIAEELPRNSPPPLNPAMFPAIVQRLMFSCTPPEIASAPPEQVPHGARLLRKSLFVMFTVQTRTHLRYAIWLLHGEALMGVASAAAENNAPPSAPDVLFWNEQSAILMRTEMAFAIGELSVAIAPPMPEQKHHVGRMHHFAYNSLKHTSGGVASE